MTLETFKYWSVRLHVVPGVVAMVVAPAAMLVTKGGWWHALWGRIFMGSMFVTLVAGVPLAYIGNDFFLLYVTVVVFYLTVSGYRIHVIKRRKYRGGLIDWIGVVVLAGAGVSATGLGLSTYWGKSVLVNAVPEVMIVMGLGVMVQAAVDFHHLVRPPSHKKAWWFIHMAKMLSAYVSAVTAVSVVQFLWLPDAVRWLWPMAVGIPGILIWVGYYRRKFRDSASPVGARVTEPVRNRQSG